MSSLIAGAWVALLFLLPGCSLRAPDTASTPREATTTLGPMVLVPSVLPAPSVGTAPTAPPTPTPAAATASPRPSPTAEPTPSPTAFIAPVSLSPLLPLAENTIVDMPLTNVQAITDGSRKYRLAAWSPGLPLIALVPQDGPGLDLVDVETGEVTAVVGDTYVLEPQWTDTGELLIHQTSGVEDTLTLYHPEHGFEEAPLVAGAPLRAPSASGGIVAFARDGETLICSIPCDGQPAPVAADEALVTAAAPARASVDLLAWTPDVTNLEEVQTFVAPVPDPGASDAMPGAWPISQPGEGLWLPRWSLDGARIALTAIGGRIAVVSFDGATRRDLGPGDSPAWSPDGARIAYAGASAGLEYTTRNLHLVQADGSGERIRLTDANDEQFYVSPSWSPDGNRLAFVELDSGQLFVGNLP